MVVIYGSPHCSWHSFVEKESDCTVSLQKMVIWVSKLNCLNNILQMSVKNYIREQSMSHTELLNKKQQIDFHRIWVMWISPEVTLRCSCSHAGDETHTAIKNPVVSRVISWKTEGTKNNLKSKLSHVVFLIACINSSKWAQKLCTETWGMWCFARSPIRSKRLMTGMIEAGFWHLRVHRVGVGKITVMHTDGRSRSLENRRVTVLRQIK